MAFASGLAAEDTLLRTVCRPGDHVVLGGDAYGGTFRLISRVLSEWGLEYTPVHLDDPDAVRAAMRPTTRVVWCETPSNPLLNITDIEAHRGGRARGRRAARRRQHLRLALPAAAADPGRGRRRPLDDQVPRRPLRRRRRRARHPRRRARRAAWPTTTTRWARSPSPFDSWLVLRSLKTLGVRMDRHSANAARVAEFLLDHPAVASVLYPGLPDAPRARHRGEADVRLRRDGLVPAEGRRGRRAEGVRPRAAVHAGRVAGRRRVADRAPGPDDPRQRGRLAAGGARPTSSGCRSASRTSTTCSPTSSRRSANSRQRVSGER